MGYRYQKFKSTWRLFSLWMSFYMKMGLAINQLADLLKDGSPGAVKRAGRKSIRLLALIDESIELLLNIQILNLERLEKYSNKRYTPSKQKLHNFYKKRNRGDI